MKIRFLDPTNKPAGLKQEIGGEKIELETMRACSNFSGMKKAVKVFRAIDLRLVDIADIVVVYVDPKVHVCGTYEELFRAKSQDKLLLAIINGGKMACPGWLFDIFDEEYMFTSVEECVDYLVGLHNGTMPLNGRVLVGSYV